MAILRRGMPDRAGLEGSLSHWRENDQPQFKREHNFSHAQKGELHVKPHRQVMDRLCQRRKFRTRPMRGYFSPSGRCLRFIRRCPEHRRTLCPLADRRPRAEAGIKDAYRLGVTAATCQGPLCSGVAGHERSPEPHLPSVGCVSMLVKSWGRWACLNNGVIGRRFICQL